MLPNIIDYGTHEDDIYAGYSRWLNERVAAIHHVLQLPRMAAGSLHHSFTRLHRSRLADGVVVPSLSDHQARLRSGNCWALPSVHLPIRGRSHCGAH